jgi:hypothetical protein
MEHLTNELEEIEKFIKVKFSWDLSELFKG